MRYLAPCSKFDFGWPVNLAVAGPCGGGGTGGGSLVAMVGDYPESCVVDLRSNARVATLAGHLDFTFAASWHPDQPHTIATGNQARSQLSAKEKLAVTLLCYLWGHAGAALALHGSFPGNCTAIFGWCNSVQGQFDRYSGAPQPRKLSCKASCVAHCQDDDHARDAVKPQCLSCAQDTSTRVWDLRKPSESVAVLCGNMGAVRALRYSPDGRVLAAAEPADFVRLYDVGAGYSRCTAAPSRCVWPYSDWQPTSTSHPCTATIPLWMPLLCACPWMNALWRPIRDNEVVEHDGDTLFKGLDVLQSCSHDLPCNVLMGVVQVPGDRPVWRDRRHLLHAGLLQLFPVRGRHRVLLAHGVYHVLRVAGAASAQGAMPLRTNSCSLHAAGMLLGQWLRCMCCVLWCGACGPWCMICICRPVE